MKCWKGNLDGQRDALVITSSQKKAAAILQCGLTCLRDYFSVQREIPEGLKQDTMYTRPIDCSLGGDKNWTEGRCEL